MDAGFGAQNRAREDFEPAVDHCTARTHRWNRDRRGTMVEFDLPLTREAMADYLGLTLGNREPPDLGAEKSWGDCELQGKRHIIVP